MKLLMAVLLLGLAAGAAWAQRVDIESDDSIDYSKYKTFRIGEGQLNSKAPSLNSDLTRRKIENEIRKQRRFLPIRTLFERAGSTIQQLKPCLLMSPLSVAQFLKPGALQFDLVLMDEASQMRPEDAKDDYKYRYIVMPMRI